MMGWVLLLPPGYLTLVPNPPNPSCRVVSSKNVLSEYFVALELCRRQLRNDGLGVATACGTCNSFSHPNQPFVYSRLKLERVI
jgi:hypothetical protein